MHPPISQVPVPPLSEHEAQAALADADADDGAGLLSLSEQDRMAYGA